MGSVIQLAADSDARPVDPQFTITRQSLSAVCVLTLSQFTQHELMCTTIALITEIPGTRNLYGIDVLEANLEKQVTEYLGG